MRCLVRFRWWLKFQWLRIRLYRFREIPIGSYIEKFSKIPEEQPDRRFRLVFFEADYNEYSRVSGSIYHDAPLNMLWWSMDQGPLAIVGFYLDRDGSIQVSIAGESDKDIVYADPSYVIRQIQGVHGFDEVLKMFRWEKMLVQAVIDLARTERVSYVHVVKAVKNKWRASVGESGLQRLHIRYDVTAKRMGFKESGCKYTLAVQL